MLVSPIMQLTAPMQKAGGEPTSTRTKAYALQTNRLTCAVK